MTESDTTYLRVKIDSKTHARFKALCVLKQTDMGSELEKVIKSYVDEELPERPKKEKKVK
ncbi:MAG: hypothetical protein WBG70_21185 [Spirulinaceae cyanobacterium]